MRESTRLRSSNSSRLHRAFAPIANSSVDPPRHCGIEPRCSGHNQLRSRSAMHARSASAHAIAITRGVRLPVGSSDDRNVRENRKSTGSKNCASTPYTGPWSRSSTRYRARVSLTLNSNRNSVAGLNGRAPLTYMRSPHSEHSMCSSPVVSVTRVTSWLHHHVSFLHNRFIIALPLSANRGLRPQT